MVICSFTFPFREKCHFLVLSDPNSLFYNFAVSPAFKLTLNRTSRVFLFLFVFSTIDGFLLVTVL